MQTSSGMQEIIANVGIAVNETSVTSKERLFLNRKTEVDAINYPTLKRIEVSRSRWKSLHADLKSRMTLVLHEYLFISGIDDDKFFYSQAMISILNPKATSDIATISSYFDQLTSLKNELIILQTTDTNQLKFCYRAGRIAMVVTQIDKFFESHPNLFSSLPRTRAKFNQFKLRIEHFANNCTTDGAQWRVTPAIIQNTIKDVESLFLDTLE